MLYRFVAIAAIIAASADAQEDANSSPISAAAIGLTPQQSMARGSVLTNSRRNTVDMRFEFSGLAAAVPDPEAPGETVELIQGMYLYRGTPANGGELILQITDEPERSGGFQSFQLNGVTAQGVPYTDELRQGLYYVNFTTLQFPTGEMAGQINGISVLVPPGEPMNDASAVLVSLSTLAACAIATTVAIM